MYDSGSFGRSFDRASVTNNAQDLVGAGVGLVFMLALIVHSQITAARVVLLEILLAWGLD